MKNLAPTHAPAEGLEIAPEALEVANAYLQLQDTRKVADELDMPVNLVSNILARREVKAYVNQVFFDIGFNNRHKMRDAMDAIIQKKFQDMHESETGSTKDIADLLALSHKMSMELMDREIQLEKLRSEGGGLKSQVNVQINNGLDDGSKYGALINKLLTGDIV
jgi:hypothetical protein